MNYPALCLVFLAAAVLAAVVLGHVGPRPRAAAVAATVLVMLVLTVVFDNVMIAVGLVGYSTSQLGGVHLGLVPLEDLAYPLAGAVVLPFWWTVLTARHPNARGGDEPGSSTKESS